MIFSLDVQSAQKGDCLIIHTGTRADPGLVVIDGGPAQVYQPQLKPRLARIRQARQLADDESLLIDLMMVSHIDDDHIRGLLELTKELVEAADSHKPLPFKIRSFWHNTFDGITGNKADELTKAVTASFGAAALEGEPDTEGLDPAAARILASVDQGIRLADDARKLNLRLNPQFGGKPVMATGKDQSIDIGKGLRITVVGPMQGELFDLQKSYADFLKKSETERKTKEVVASFTDTSVPNLSSLVLVAQVDQKRILLTGDARGDKILKGLELVGMLKKGGTMHVDVLKMPHHGSDRNIDPIFFQRIKADHYVFSGNGENGNPERATLQMLLNDRGDDQFTIHLTYPIKDIDDERKKDWEKEQQKEKSRKKKNSNADVRKDWVPEENSLESFFAAHKDFAGKVSLVEAGKPHVINLLENVAF